MMTGGDMVWDILHVRDPLSTWRRGHGIHESEKGKSLWQTWRWVTPACRKQSRPLHVGNRAPLQDSDPKGKTVKKIEHDAHRY